MLKVLAIESILKQGSSLPAIVTSESGKKYLLKFRGAGEGSLNSISEFIAASLGNHIGLPVLKPELLTLGNDTINKVKNDELYDLIKWSEGINIGFEFIEKAVSFESSDNLKLDVEIKSLIYLYDLFLLNIDRNKGNSNVIISEGRIIATDYGSSFLIRYLINNETVVADARIIAELRRNPFYSIAPDPRLLTDRFKSVSEKILKSIVDDIPNNWIDAGLTSAVSIKKYLMENLNRLMNDPAHLSGVIRMVDQSVPVTDEERQLQRYKNLNLFKERFGKM
ncbi:MAG: HipA family kinase [bacterium]